MSISTITGRAQQGVATLAFALVVLLLMTMIALFTARSMITEQRVSANVYRTQQAEAAASAAIDLGIRLMNGDNIRVDRNGDGDTVDTTTNPPETLTIANALTNSIVCTVRQTDDNGDGDTADPGETVSAHIVGITNCARIMNPTLPPALGGATAYIRNPENGFLLPVTLGFDCHEASGGTCADSPYDVWGFGWSDDGTARHRVVVMAGNMDLNGEGRPALPLSAWGSVESGGNLKITNMYNNDAVWSGNQVTLQGTPTTRIWRPGDNTVATCNLTGNDYASFLAAHTLVASDPGVGVNADIIDNDPNLKTLSADEYWHLFFPAEPAEVRALANGQGQLYPGGNSLPDLNGKTGIIWIDGSASITGQPVVGQYGNPQANPPIPARPAIVIVDGDLSTGGGVTFNGLVFVRGTYTGGGGARFNGILAVDHRPATGPAVPRATGTADICFDPTMALGNKGLVSGAIGVVPGSWRDWNVF